MQPGEGRRTRTFNQRIKSPLLYQLSYAPEGYFSSIFSDLDAAGPERLERPTYGSEVRCSIQLSYEPEAAVRPGGIDSCRVVSVSRLLRGSATGTGGEGVNEISVTSGTHSGFSWCE